MLLILIRGSPPLGLLELSRFPWVPHPRGPHHSFRNPHSLTLLAHLLQRTTKPACGPPLQAPRNHNKIWRAVGKDVQSQLRHKDSSLLLCTLNRDLWFEFVWHLIIVSHPSLCVRWIGIGILAPPLALQGDHHIRSWSIFWVCVVSQLRKGCMLSRRECVAWLMVLIPCPLCGRLIHILEFDWHLVSRPCVSVVFGTSIATAVGSHRTLELGVCYHRCTSCRPSRLESVAWFTFVFLLLTPVSVSVCVCALNCGGSPSPEPHHNWQFGAFLICNFCMHFVKLELVVFLGIFAGTLSRVGGIELFAHCSPLAAVCVGNPFTWMALRIEVLARHYGSSLQYAVAMSWFTSIEISTLKFGMWSSAQVATVGWQFSFNPLCGIGCDLLSTCPLQGTLHRILHNYGWWGYVKWVSGILEQIFCESIELFWFRCTWRINPSTQLIENEVFAGMDSVCTPAGVAAASSLQLVRTCEA